VLAVDELARVLLQVDAGDADAPGRAVHPDVQMAVLRQGQFVLGNLVALGEIGIEIILPGKNRFFIDPAVGGQGHFQGEIHGLAVQDRQSPGHPQADLADLGVGRGSEMGGAAAENLAGGQEFGVDFQPDNRFVCHHLNLSLGKEWGMESLFMHKISFKISHPQGGCQVGGRKGGVRPEIKNEVKGFPILSRQKFWRFQWQHLNFSDRYRYKI